MSENDIKRVPDASNMCFGIVVAEYNYKYTSQILEHCTATLEEHGALPENIHVKSVPGSLELVYGAHQIARNDGYDAVIVLGSIIKDTTPHFEYICHSVTNGISHLNTTSAVPVIFGVIMAENEEMAQGMCDGSVCNNGKDAAVSAIKMAKF